MASRMEPTVLVSAAVVGLAAVAYVVAPLFRDEDDIRPFDRPRVGVLWWPGVERVDHDEDGDSPVPPDWSDAPGRGDADARPLRCPHCGREVERGYRYCASCVHPVAG